MRVTDLAAPAFNEVALYISEWAKRKGFWDRPIHLESGSPNEKWLTQLVKSQKNALMVTEVAEHLEALRKPQLPSSLEGFTAEEEEIADLIIRALDYAGYFKMRIGEAIAAKMAKNEGRPYKHGKEF